MEYGDEWALLTTGTPGGRVAGGRGLSIRLLPLFLFSR